MPLQETARRGLTIRQFAQQHSMSESAVRAHCRTGRIDSYKVGGARRIPDTAPPPRHDDDFMAEVRRIVDLAPKLTPAQRDLIATILRPSAGGNAA
jgi:hypothetical protein